MKIKAILITLLVGIVMVCEAATVATKERTVKLEPTDWYVGMKDTSLQIMVYGSGIGTADVTTMYEGVHVDSLVRLH